MSVKLTTVFHQQSASTVAAAQPSRLPHHRSSLTSCVDAVAQSATARTAQVSAILASMTPAGCSLPNSNLSSGSGSGMALLPSSTSGLHSLDFTAIASTVAESRERTEEDRVKAAEASNSEPVTVVDPALLPGHFYSLDASLQARIAEEKYFNLLQELAKLSPNLVNLKSLPSAPFGNIDTIQNTFAKIIKDHNESQYDRVLYYGVGGILIAAGAFSPLYLSGSALKLSAVAFGTSLGTHVVAASATKMAVTKSTIKARFVNVCNGIRGKFGEYGRKLIELYLHNKHYVAPDGTENREIPKASARHNHHEVVKLSLALFKNLGNIKQALKIISTFNDPIRQNDFKVEVGLTGSEIDPIMIPLHNALSNILRDALKDQLTVLQDSGCDQLDLSLLREEPQAKANAVHEGDLKELSEFGVANLSDDEMTLHFIERNEYFTAQYQTQKANEARRQKYRVETEKKERELNEKLAEAARLSNEISLKNAAFQERALSTENALSTQLRDLGRANDDLKTDLLALVTAQKNEIRELTQQVKELKGKFKPLASCKETDRELDALLNAPFTSAVKVRDKANATTVTG